VIRSQTTAALDLCQLFSYGHKLQERVAHAGAILAS
jgi:hypothetical protein